MKNPSLSYRHFLFRQHLIYVILVQHRRFQLCHKSRDVYNPFIPRAQAKLQKIAIPSLFKGGTPVSGPKQRPPSLLRDPPAVLAGKRSTAFPPDDLGASDPKKRGRGRPHVYRIEQSAPIIPADEPDVLNDINETLPTIYPVRKRQWNRQGQYNRSLFSQMHLFPFDEDQTAIKQIQAQNIQDNRNLTRRTIDATPNAHDTIPMVIEDHQPVDMDRHFPHHRPLTSVFTKYLQLKTRRDVPNQKVIDKIVEQNNHALLQSTICIGYIVERSMKGHILLQYN